MPIDLAMGLSPDDQVNNSNLDEFVIEQQEKTEEAYRIAREHLHEGAQRSKRAYDARVKTSEFKVGDYVYYYCPRRYTQRSPKWQQCYTGPFRIVREIPPVNFVLQKSPRSAAFVVHTDKLKLCHSDAPASPPAISQPALAPPAAEPVKSKRRVTFAPDAEVHEVSRWIGETSEDEASSQSNPVSSGRPERVRRPPPALQDYHCTGQRSPRLVRAASVLAQSLCAANPSGQCLHNAGGLDVVPRPFHADICGTEATRGEVQVPASTVPASTVHGVRAE